MSDIEGRKRQHIDAVLNEDVSSKGLTTGFEDYRFDHVALPETDLEWDRPDDFAFREATCRTACCFPA